MRIAPSRGKGISGNSRYLFAFPSIFSIYIFMLFSSHFPALLKVVSFPFSQQDGHDKVRIFFRSWTFNHCTPARESLWAGFVPSLCKTCKEKKKTCDSKRRESAYRHLAQWYTNLFNVLLIVDSHCSPLPMQPWNLCLTVSFSVSAFFSVSYHLLTSLPSNYQI